MVSNNIKRGAFIVFEGCDKSGKSTQCRKLVEALSEMGIRTERIQFPDRSTATGMIINNYLLKKNELSDQAVHLLFTANRWESEPKIRRLLHEGVTLVADRYSFSGVAYSSAKPNLNMDWCKIPETGLPKPDLVFLLKAVSSANERDGFGEERYETREFQKLVYENYLQMKDETWRIVDSDKSIDEVHNEILNHASEAVKKAETRPLLSLCPEIQEEAVLECFHDRGLLISEKIVKNLASGKIPAVKVYNRLFKILGLN